MVSHTYLNRSKTHHIMGLLGCGFTIKQKVSKRAPWMVVTVAHKLCYLWKGQMCWWRLFASKKCFPAETDTIFLQPFTGWGVIGIVSRRSNHFWVSLFFWTCLHLVLGYRFVRRFEKWNASRLTRFCFYKKNTLVVWDCLGGVSNLGRCSMGFRRLLTEIRNVFRIRSVGFTCQLPAHIRIVFFLQMGVCRTIQWRGVSKLRTYCGCH